MTKKAKKKARWNWYKHREKILLIGIPGAVFLLFFTLAMLGKFFPNDSHTPSTSSSHSETGITPVIVPTGGSPSSRSGSSGSRYRSSGGPSSGK